MSDYQFPKDSAPWNLSIPLDNRQGLGIFLFVTVSTPSQGPTQSSIKWVPRALSMGVKR